MVYLQKSFSAKSIVEELYSPSDAVGAQEKYEAIGSGNRLEDIQEIATTIGTTLMDLLIQGGFATSKGQARRLIEQGGVRLNGEQIRNLDFVTTDDANGSTLQVGKKTQDSYRRIALREKE